MTIPHVSTYFQAATSQQWSYMVRPVNSIGMYPCCILFAVMVHSQKHVPGGPTVNKAFYKSVIGASRRQGRQSIPSLVYFRENKWLSLHDQRRQISHGMLVYQGLSTGLCCWQLSTQQCWHNQISRGADKPGILSPWQSVPSTMGYWFMGPLSSTGNTGERGS